MAMTPQEVAAVNGPIYQDFQLLGRQMRSTYSKDPQTMVQYAGYVDAFAERISTYQNGAIYNSSGLLAACKGSFCHKWTCDNIISQYHMYGDKSKWMAACIQAIQDFVPIAENPRLSADAASVLSSIGSASHHQQQQQQQQQREPINIPQQQRQTLNRLPRPQPQQREPINMPQQQRQTLNIPRPQQQHRQPQQHTRPQQQHQYQQRQTINRRSRSQTQQYQREPLQYQQRRRTQYRQQPLTQYQTPSQRLQQYRGGINVSGGGINVSGGGINVSGGNNGSGALPGISSSVRAAVQDVVQNRRKRRRRDAGVPRQKRSTEAVLLSATRSFIIFNKARQYLYLVASLEASFEEISPQHRVGKEIFDVCGNADVNALGRLIFGWEPAPRRYSIGPATARFLTKGDWRVFKPAFQHIRRHITTLVTSDHKKAAKDYILNILNNDNNNSVSDNNDNMDDMGNNINEMGNVNSNNNINSMENIENENNNNIHEMGNVNNDNNINSMENIVNENNNNTNEIGNVNNNNNINAMENIVNGNNNDSSSGYGPIRGQGHATHQTFAPF